MIYMAPAARPFSEAHIKDEKRKPRASASHGGWTRCGERMDPEGLWIEMKVAETDPVCSACSANRRIEVKVLALW
jgi:hypothetical protein